MSAKELTTIRDIPIILSLRDKMIYERYLACQSFEKVGREFGISGERARQIYGSAMRRTLRGERLAGLRRAFSANS